MNLILFVAACCILMCHVDTYDGLFTKEAELINGMCVGPDGKLHEPNQNWYDDEKCEILVCKEQSNGKYYIHFTGCSVGSLVLTIQQQQDNCRFQAGVGPFPNCCPNNIVCDTELGLEPI